MIIPVLSTLLPFVASSRMGSSATSRRRRRLQSSAIKGLDIVSAQSLISLFGGIEAIMDPGIILFLKRDGGKEMAKYVSERDEQIVEANISRISPDKIKHLSLVETGLGRTRTGAPRAEIERLLQFKHYQMKTLYDESMAISEDHPENWDCDWFQPGEPRQNLFLIHNGSIWAGSDYIVRRESEFPIDTPYPSPFKSLHSSQAYVNDFIRNEPEEIVYSLVNSRS